MSDLRTMLQTFSLLALLPVSAAAEAMPLFATSDAAVPFFSTRGDPTAARPHSAGSLFAGRDGSSLFAALPDRVRADPLGTAGDATPAARIRDVIAQAEAGRKGYDAVQYGARVPPPAPPTQLTLDEIERWTRATPGQPHAIGRYQFIPATLRRLVREAGLPADTVFTSRVQDQLADMLLNEAGLAAFEDGVMSRHTFMRNLSRIWAGLPLPDGRSYYQGYAGNKATMTWAHFEAAMTRIFPG